MTLETCALPNLGYEVERHLGPGEIVRITAGRRRACSRRPATSMQICSFLWVYYGYPASSYEGINVEVVRNRCGAALARARRRRRSTSSPASRTPASATPSATPTRRGIPYRRPFVKYTPTWPRSFMPQDQRVRDLVARMKLIPIRELIDGQRLLFCEDSIVRGTQLRDIITRLYDHGAREVHMRPACPPLVYSAASSSTSRARARSSTWPAARRSSRSRATPASPLDEYANPKSERHARMVEVIRKHLGLTTLKYQMLDDMIAAIGLPREKLCTYCWDGAEPCAAAVPDDAAPRRVPH